MAPEPSPDPGFVVPPVPLLLLLALPLPPAPPPPVPAAELALVLAPLVLSLVPPEPLVLELLLPASPPAEPLVLDGPPELVAPPVPPSSEDPEQPAASAAVSVSSARDPPKECAFMARTISPGRRRTAVRGAAARKKAAHDMNNCSNSDGVTARLQPGGPSGGAKQFVRSRCVELNSRS
ncbi:hypothetical protein [Sorangium sp. So ce1335]|uniref:hypothetical protein n=1 Tax=Sorangium sp. So ce1335 TaxID=3133335 RepID=UPI003F6263BF